MKTRLALALLGASIWLAACSSHPPPPSRQEPPPKHPATAMLTPYAAADGSLTRAQMEAGLRRDFDKADTNHDGCLNADQVRAIDEQRWKEDGSTASPLIDFKQNGCVDFDEFAAAPRSLFDQIEVDGNGKLTAKELHSGNAAPANAGGEKHAAPPPPPGGEGGEGPGGDSDDHAR